MTSSIMNFVTAGKTMIMSVLKMAQESVPAAIQG